MVRYSLVLALVIAPACGGDDDDGNGGAPDAGGSVDGAVAIDADPGAGPDAAPTFTLSVSAGTEGTVTSDVGGIACASDGTGVCEATFDAGTVVTLTAAPGASFELFAWRGACAGGDASVAVTMDGDKSCAAAFLGASGDIDVIDPPVSVVPHQTEDSAAIMMFVEQQDFELPVDLQYDTHVPALWDQLPRTLGTVPAGARVDVYFVHFDPVGTGAVSFNATITVPNDIIGIIVGQPSNDTADTVVGRDDIQYPAPGVTLRAIELDAEDSLIFHPDRRTVTLMLRTGISADQMRIVTVADGQDMPPLQADTVEVIDPPADVSTNVTESGTHIRIFDEANGVTLAEDLVVDVTANGLVNAAADLTPGTIAAGTTVSSQLVHFDAPSNTLLRGSYDFGRPIAGVIVLSANLDASDAALGAATTTYPAAGVDVNRGMEPSGTEQLHVGDDGQSLWFALDSAPGSDQLRVVFAD